MGLIGFILVMFGLGVIIVFSFKDSSKQTLGDSIKEDLSGIEGQTAIVLIARALYILLVFGLLVILPFIFIANSIDQWLNKNLSVRPWHQCEYIDYHLKHDGSWVDGRWYEWKDRYGNIEIARMKLDAIDHFFPRAEIIKEEDVAAFREIEEAPIEQEVM